MSKIFSGRVYGRRVLPIRVCASPHRDRRLEEARATKNVNGELSPTVTVKEEALAPVVGPSADGINDPLGPLDQMFFVPVCIFEQSLNYMLTVQLVGQQL